LEAAVLREIIEEGQKWKKRLGQTEGAERMEFGRVVGGEKGEMIGNVWDL
jgi:hypothetical protein